MWMEGFIVNNQGLNGSISIIFSDSRDRESRSIYWLHQKTDLEVGKGLKHKGILSNILTSVFISVELRTDYHSVQKGFNLIHTDSTSGVGDLLLIMDCTFYI